MVFDISACIKTFIAVQRGCCAAFPFHVIWVFTNKSATMLIIYIYLFNLISNISSEFVEVLCTTHYSSTNDTYYSNYTIKLRIYFSKTAVIYACEVMILLSLIVIVSGMTSTSKWRQSLSVARPCVETPSRLLKQNAKGET